MSSKLANSKISNLGTPKTAEESHIMIDGRYCLIKLKDQSDFYNLYDGIDISQSKWVNIYIKPIGAKKGFSNKINQNLRNLLCPKVICSGTTDIGNGSYDYQIHQRYGPTLKTMFTHLKAAPSQKDLLHLLLQMLRLVEKMSSMKLVSGSLSPNVIVFDSNPNKNELYLLNCFSLKKRGQTVKVKNTKYCSRGMHLGRNIEVKDDLESVCYILIDIYTGGQFLKGKTIEQYKEIKLSSKIHEFGKNIPKVLIDFYNYVTSINCKDEIDFFHWKTYLTRILTTEFVNKSYGFKLMKGQKSQKQNGLADYDQQTSLSNDQIQIDENLQEEENVMAKLVGFLNHTQFVPHH